MGGYGAMRLALTYPEHFAGAASFSGAVDLANTLFQRHREGEIDRVFGNMKEIKGTEYDNYYLMEKNANAAHKPWLYVSCGTKDFLYQQHRTFIPALKKSGWDVMSHEEPEYGRIRRHAAGADLPGAFRRSGFIQRSGGSGKHALSAAPGR